MSSLSGKKGTCGQLEFATTYSKPVCGSCILLVCFVCFDMKCQCCTFVMTCVNINNMSNLCIENQFSFVSEQLRMKVKLFRFS